MEVPVFVSKARNAFHSAAAKAERVLLDFKSDRDPDKQSPSNLTGQAEYKSRQDGAESKLHDESKHTKWRSPHIRIKQNLQDKIKSVRIGRKEAEGTDKVRETNMAVSFYDENLYILYKKNDLEARVIEAIPSVEGLTAATKDPIPPSSVIKQLAIAVVAGRKTKSISDFLTLSGSSSPIIERAGIGLSTVKALLLREKEDKLKSEFNKNEKVTYLINSLFEPEGEFLRRKINTNSEETVMTSLPRDIHGAPPESLVVKVAEIMGNFKTLQKMALFWFRVVTEVGKLWYEEQHIPGVPQDEIPDLKSCLLYQQLQVINCCVSRRRRHAFDTESMDMLMEVGSNIKEPLNYGDRIPASPLLYARLNTGELVLRLGTHSPSGDVTLLETGEPVYSPVTQEGPLLTEDLIKETEEFVLRTGSVGAGCSHLLSDMQAFKAANPGCILEDFVRWHSPPDWIQSEACMEDNDFFDGGEPLSNRGQLSRRMQKEEKNSELSQIHILGNLWRELWETAKPVPAVKQAPLFDEDLAVEGILKAFDDIQPSQLFEQLFISLLGAGVAIAEPMLSGETDFSKVFSDCKDYIVTTFQGSNWTDKLDDICQVYETVEVMIMNPKEVLKMIKQPEESTAATGELNHQSKKRNFIFGGKDNQWKKSVLRDQLNSEESPVLHSLTSFFDSKSYFFSKKPPKTGTSTPPAQKTTYPESLPFPVY